nr:NADH-ubiquinone oxidoreductase chain 2 [Tanacetum cinerariifolium]
MVNRFKNLLTRLRRTLIADIYMYVRRRGGYLVLKFNIEHRLLSGYRFTCQQGKSIGRIHNVPISTGDAFYYRMLLNSAKGYGTHDEIKKVNEVVYPTYKEAYYATGLLEDDKEYIECIEDA